MRRYVFPQYLYVFSTAILTISLIPINLLAQSLASGTIEGAVFDSSGAVVVGAMVEIQNPITGFQQTTVIDSTGTFRFTNIPFNPYHLQISQQGFAPAAQ